MSQMDSWQRLLSASSEFPFRVVNTILAAFCNAFHDHLNSIKFYSCKRGMNVLPVSWNLHTDSVISVVALSLHL